MPLDDLFGLRGAVAIVTAGGSGIGKASALLLAQVGANLCVVDRDAETAAAIAHAIEDAGSQAFSLAGDAREPSLAAEAARATQERYGRIDILVNVVGGTFFAPAQDLSPNAWSAIMRLNFDSTMLFSQAVAPAMRAAGKGAIVNMASVTGVTASPRSAHYGAAKAAIISLTRSLAVEWAPAIRVNAVAPGFVRTEGTDRLVTDADRERFATNAPLGRLAVAQDVAKVVLFLASDLASYVTGQTLVVDGGSLLAEPP